MSLYIRDRTVDELATRLQKAIGARTKTEAVRRALEQELERVEDGKPFEERIARSLAMADAMGQGGHDFDVKAFLDEMWDEA